MVAPGGHAWLLRGGMRSCSGGMHGCSQRGACVVFSGGCAWFFPGGVRRIRRGTVNERAVCILLECILVLLLFERLQNLKCIS